MDKKYYFARQMRNTPTKSEAQLWEILRNKRLEGLRFKRQHLIKPYIVDFCCTEKRLIIEVDGGIHWQPGMPEADEERQRYLESLGYQVIRLSNDDVMENLEGVQAFITEVVSTPHADSTH